MLRIFLSKHVQAYSTIALHETWDGDEDYLLVKINTYEATDAATRRKEAKKKRCTCSLSPRKTEGKHL